MAGIERSSKGTEQTTRRKKRHWSTERREAYRNAMVVCDFVDASHTSTAHPDVIEYMRGLNNEGHNPINVIDTAHKQSKILNDELGPLPSEGERIVDPNFWTVGIDDTAKKQVKKHEPHTILNRVARVARRVALSSAMVLPSVFGLHSETKEAFAQQVQTPSYPLIQVNPFQRIQNENGFTYVIPDTRTTSGIPSLQNAFLISTLQQVGAEAKNAGYSRGETFVLSSIPALSLRDRTYHSGYLSLKGAAEGLQMREVLHRPFHPFVRKDAQAAANFFKLHPTKTRTFVTFVSEAARTLQPQRIFGGDKDKVKIADGTQPFVTFLPAQQQ